MHCRGRTLPRCRCRSEPVGQRVRDPIEHRLTAADPVARRRRLRDLPLGERWLLGEAFIGLSFVALALRVGSLRRVLTILGWSLPRSLVHDDEARASRAADLLGVAARRGLFSSNCLSRSVTLWWLLRRRRIAAELRIGVRREGPILLAHAWVEHGGRPLNDSEAMRARFAVFDGSILPPAARWS